MEGLRPDSPSARLLTSALDTSFTLIDVGCSGGIDAGWSVFGDRLVAFGFDPGRDEIARLSAAEARPGVRYLNGFVGLPADHPLKGAAVEPWRHDPWGRLSAYRSQELQQQRAASASASAVDISADQDLMQRNLWREAALAEPDKPIVLPQFFADQGLADIDFIKIDVDGTDFEILRSLETDLADRDVLGVMLEVNYHGGGGEHFNTFHNTDRFMRDRGFDLLDLTVRKYALAALPFPYLFAHPFAAQTTRGRPWQGDALYLRDVGFAHRGDFPSTLSARKLVKLAALYCLFGLLDHAAELLLFYRERLSTVLDIDAALAVMTAEIQALDPDLAGKPLDGYGDYIAAFEADDCRFYGANDRRNFAAATLAAERDAAVEARDALLEQAAKAEVEARRVRRESDRLRDRVREMETSTSWKATRGLRALGRVLGRR